MKFFKKISLWSFFFNFGMFVMCSGIESPDKNNTQPKLTIAKLGVPDNVKTFSQGNNEFAFKLYNALKSQKGNALFSPYSLYCGLAMVYSGAKNETAAQMKDVLHFDLPQNELNSAFEWFIEHTSTRPGNPIEEDTLITANSLWLQMGFPFLTNFTDTISKYYRGAAKQVDFIHQPESARSSINNWVKERTQGKISDVLAADSIEPATRLVLISANYMKYRWQHPFETENTRQQAFFPNDENTISVPMMFKVGKFGYAKQSSFVMVELPYNAQGQKFSKIALYILLPDETSGLSDLENILTEDNFQKWIVDLNPTKIELALPHFKITDNLTLTQVFKNMGLTKPFTKEADFSAMTNQKNLMISDVIHKTFISVDEKGTEASGATGVIMNMTATYDPANPISVRVDHPFIFLVAEKTTGTILYIGKVEKP